MDLVGQKGSDCSAIEMRPHRLVCYTLHMATNLAIDDELLDLLNKRANCSIEIGRIKRSRNLQIYDPKREDRILDRMVEANGQSNGSSNQPMAIKAPPP